MEEMEGQDLTGIPVELGDYNAPAMDQLLAGNQPDFLNQCLGGQEAINEIPMNYGEYSSPMQINQLDPVPINQEQYLPSAVNQEQYPPPAPPNQQYAQPTPNQQFQQYAQPTANQQQYAQPPGNQQFQNYAQQNPSQQYGPQKANQNYGQPNPNQQYGPQKANQNYGQPNPNPNQHFQQYAPPKFNQQYAQTPPLNRPYPQPSMNPNYAYQQNPQSTPVNQAYPLMAPGQGAWSSQLFDCFDDLPLWLFTFFCPCVVFGQIAEIVDKGSSSCITTGAIYGLILGLSGCQSIYSCTYRTKMRHQYGIPGDDMEDYCTHLWCESCALFQEYKHLSARGYDVPLGWYGQRKAQGVQMAPVAPNGMTR